MALESGLTYILMNIILNFSIYLILSLSLNIEVGFTGIPQFGRLTAALVGSIAVGGVIGRVAATLIGAPTGSEFISYNAPIITQINNYLSTHAIASITLLVLAILTAVLLGALIGLLTALPAIRLKESYLGITLLSFGEILRTITYNSPEIIGGTLGIAAPSFFSFTGAYESFAVMLFIVLMAIFCYLIAERISKSPLGRVMRAVRDSELASQVYGRDIMIVRIYAIVIGSSMAALAGALYSIFTKSVRADIFTRYSWTFLPWAYIMLGGVGNNLGVALGVIILTIARSTISIYKYEISELIPIDPVWLEYILIGMVIILLTLFRPQGILPEKPVTTVSKKELEDIKRKVASFTS
ncbi:branched-chain amino acid ABC transporter permease [Ignisphaera sp. 4213-co]|uniref:Branched-chain amino acid ABC transporter permease n=1 Tax=Ignisphaera cupida TaxID=3050454 RepID=A0ABD4Z751_9CREN|nr:branched-chain amino acid ABC transporter permease [Ignisphaera sp. 4213-co]MDK6029156.1 branched-chain amino acid ABC transporter permease [Ignisphaera sp. 4213-co]